MRRPACPREHRARYEQPRVDARPCPSVNRIPTGLCVVCSSKAEIPPPIAPSFICGNAGALKAQRQPGWPSGLCMGASRGRSCHFECWSQPWSHSTIWLHGWALHHSNRHPTAWSFVLTHVGPLKAEKESHWPSGRCTNMHRDLSCDFGVEDLPYAYTT